MRQPDPDCANALNGQGADLTQIPEAIALEIAALANGDRARTGQAYDRLLAAAAEKVDWGAEAWPALLPFLTDADNHVRSIAGQVLSRLAISVPTGVVLDDFGKIIAVTHDEKFVTARHVLQSSWRIGLAGPKARALLIDTYNKRFAAAAAEKNGSLVRFDIIVAIRHLRAATDDAGLDAVAEELIATETDLKYRKKFAAALKGG